MVITDQLSKTERKSLPLSVALVMMCLHSSKPGTQTLGNEFMMTISQNTVTRPIHPIIREAIKQVWWPKSITSASGGGKNVSGSELTSVIQRVTDQPGLYTNMSKTGEEERETESRGWGVVGKGDP